jgi:hypothetical protein
VLIVLERHLGTQNVAVARAVLFDEHPPVAEDVEGERRD